MPAPSWNRRPEVYVTLVVKTLVVKTLVVKTLVVKTLVVKTLVVKTLAVTCPIVESPTSSIRRVPKRAQNPLSVYIHTHTRMHAYMRRLRDYRTKKTLVVKTLVVKTLVLCTLD